MRAAIHDHMLHAGAGQRHQLSIVHCHTIDGDLAIGKLYGERARADCYVIEHVSSTTVST